MVASVLLSPSGVADPGKIFATLPGPCPCFPACSDGPVQQTQVQIIGDGLWRCSRLSAVDDLTRTRNYYYFDVKRCLLLFQRGMPDRRHDWRR
jgi:hypothetical protein